MVFQAISEHLNGKFGSWIISLDVERRTPDFHYTNMMEEKEQAKDCLKDAFPLD
jgi:hypothetical protein